MCNGDGVGKNGRRDTRTCREIMQDYYIYRYNLFKEKYEKNVK